MYCSSPAAACKLGIGVLKLTINVTIVFPDVNAPFPSLKFSMLSIFSVNFGSARR